MVIVLALWILSGFTGVCRAEAVKSSCLVMPGNRVSEKYFADYAGERFYFCCRPCVKAFKRNPHKYLDKQHLNDK